MSEIKLSIISDKKHVAIHVTDADAVLNQVADGTGPLKSIAQPLKQVVDGVLINAGDADKIELTPTGGIHHKANGEKVPFAL